MNVLIVGEVRTALENESFKVDVKNKLCSVVYYVGPGRPLNKKREYKIIDKYLHLNIRPFNMRV